MLNLNTIKQKPLNLEYLPPPFPLITQKVMFNLKYYFRVEYSTAQYIREGNDVTLAPQLFPIFCMTLCLSIQQPHTLNKLQYLVDGDISKVT
jgi:hypothetical protein